ncbi:hypothetical protein NMYAN_10168 [Nitrosomonas nitrosa]|uniref:Uncharacterized protein n=1 Tax=Nitrosomonas nitrosa TaxID=52442 RepID=A0A8H9D8U1_9PROT|nr:hypothetical protein NMYAN_10168 [Nitrosomonas nitrosa]
MIIPYPDVKTGQSFAQVLLFALIIYPHSVSDRVISMRFESQIHAPKRYPTQASNFKPSTQKIITFLFMQRI